MNQHRIPFAALALACALPCAAQTWQQSTAAAVELGVRDKYGDKPFRAEFVVVGPQGRETRSITVEGSAFGVVHYPGDFGGYMAPGQYRWSARVDGKVVADGRFGFVQDDSSQRLTVPE
ncbi:hypothetical protein CLD22_13420 [Rubrivivax gelatinosus]|nr:hypothetical protein [Rubrivivax gelatinosus]